METSGGVVSFGTSTASWHVSRMLPCSVLSPANPIEGKIMSRMNRGCLSGARIGKLQTIVWVALFIVLIGGAAGFGSPAYAGDQALSGTEALAIMEVTGPVQDLGVPVYAHLVDGEGNEYALVAAPSRTLARTGRSYRVIDDTAAHGSYFIARERREGAREAAKGRFTVLHDDGRHILVKGGRAVSRELPELGFDLKAISSKPMVFRAAEPPMPMGRGAIAYDSRVSDMISQVHQAGLQTEIENISGVNAVTIGGHPYTIATRYTDSGTPIKKATQYMHERLDALGLSVSYQNWSASDYSGRNVIAEKKGKSKPREIVLVTCHLDSLPATGNAPGADDNGSGCVAVLTAAGIMKPYTFDRTVRFAFFTGEEQGIYGAGAYAAKVSKAKENIVAVYNMDMIAWSSTSEPNLRLHTRTSSSSGYDADLAIANTFSEVVETYDLTSSLTPIITSDGEVNSDHSRFWDQGYAAILAIEDDTDDFNPNLHSTDDVLENLNMAYFTSYAKASIGTAAHLAGLADKPEETLTVHKSGSGSGTVTSSHGGIDCGTTCKARFTNSISVTLTATAADNSVFTGWSPASICFGTGTCTVIMHKDTGVTAHFKGPETLKVHKVSTNKGSGTVTSSPDGIDCGNTCTARFTYNTPVTLTATAGANSVFTGWSNTSACFGTDTRTVTMDEATSVTANFMGE